MSDYRSVHHSGGIGVGWVAIAIIFHAICLGASVLVTRVSDTTIAFYGLDGLKVCDTATLVCRRLSTTVTP